MKLRNILLIILGLLQCNLSYSLDFDLKNGDLIFQESCFSDIDTAIKSVTHSADSYNFTHVGIVWIDQKADTFVIEATPPKVAITALNDYFKPESEHQCYPRSVVARLKSQFQHLIPKAINEAIKHVGKDYDYVFRLDDDKYYCSELVYEIFRKANNNKPVFELNIMTFKAKESDDFLTEWIEYYKKHQADIPEGEMGINPGAMSRSGILDFIGEY